MQIIRLPAGNMNWIIQIIQINNLSALHGRSRSWTVLSVLLYCCTAVLLYCCTGNRQFVRVVNLRTLVELVEHKNAGPCLFPLGPWRRTTDASSNSKRVGPYSFGAAIWNSHRTWHSIHSASLDLYILEAPTPTRPNQYKHLPVVVKNASDIMCRRPVFMDASRHFLTSFYWF